MADAIHHSLALDDQAHVEVSDENAFALGERGHDMSAFRRDDGRHAAAGERFVEALIVGHPRLLGVAEPAGGIHDEAAAFERMVADRDFNLVGENRTYE